MLGKSYSEALQPSTGLFLKLHTSLNMQTSFPRNGAGHAGTTNETQVTSQGCDRVGPYAFKDFHASLDRLSAMQLRSDSEGWARRVEVVLVALEGMSVHVTAGKLADASPSFTDQILAPPR